MKEIKPIGAIALLIFILVSIACSAPAVEPYNLHISAETTEVASMIEIADSAVSSADWVTYTISEGLPDNWIRALAIAPDGAVWAGTESGLARYNGEVWAAYVTEDGIPGNDGVRELAFATDGTLWLSTEDNSTHYGVTRFDGESWRTYGAVDGLAGDYVTSIVATPDGAMWFGTSCGVSRFYQEDWLTYTTKDGLACNWVNAIATATDGSLWLGTECGVSRYDGERWVNYAVDNSEVRAIAAINNEAAWIGTTSEGVIYLQGGNWTVHLPGSNVSSMAIAPDGTLWVGTMTLSYNVGHGNMRTDPDSGGLYHFKGKDSFANIWTTYSKKDGLASNRILVLTVAPDGTVWIGTDAGISRYNPSAR